MFRRLQRGRGASFAIGSERGAWPSVICENSPRGLGTSPQPGSAPEAGHRHFPEPRVPLVSTSPDASQGAREPPLPHTGCFLKLHLGTCRQKPDPRLLPPLSANPPGAAARALAHQPAPGRGAGAAVSPTLTVPQSPKGRRPLEKAGVTHAPAPAPVCPSAHSCWAACTTLHLTRAVAQGQAGGQDRPQGSRQRGFVVSLAHTAALSQPCPSRWLPPRSPARPQAAPCPRRPVPGWGPGARPALESPWRLPGKGRPVPRGAAAWAPGALTPV